MVTAALAKERGFAVHALSVDYGQRHRLELESARRIAERLGLARHTEIALDLRAFGGSALTDAIDVPKGGVGEDIPVTYVPARNLVFLALTTACAEAAGARDVFIGVNALDYSGYPDCRHQGWGRGCALYDPRAAAAHDQSRYRPRMRSAGAGSGLELVVL
jgi:7-cyano-7-deazaguanine synthase